MSGVLQPVDMNVDRSPARKRARYEELSNDSSNESGRWSLHRGNANEECDNGVGRLDCDVEDLLTDDDTIFCKQEPTAIDVSCVSMSPNTRSQQLSLLESSLTKDSLDKLTLGEYDALLVKKPVIRPNSKINYFDLLSDEIVLQIFKCLPKWYLRDMSFVCRRFNRLSKDESLWRRLDASNKHLYPGDLGQIISKQVIVLRLARSEISYPPIMPGCKAAQHDFHSRLLYLDLSMASICTESLTVLLSKCNRLKKLSLENVAVNDAALIALSANKDLEVINMAMCQGVMEDGLKYLLTNCRNVVYNIIKFNDGIVVKLLERFFKWESRDHHRV
ncbi:unnamed protein product [Acanthoscelides obtectus]|uniref:F-box domain-containing protein n=1 Tax=Acanthoscelides obtectus TaxID=200917 RepID=A0A9P0P962_ACAOB|nr:unnamed protein product [Acanthoscelides obtectus]CAK1644643.1 S-phase kinase-associated protein 2 [Acanthoscelides obtectus]